MDQLETEHTQSSRVLVYDHDEIDTQALWTGLSGLVGVSELIHSSTPPDFHDKVQNESFDLVVLNCNLEELGGPLLFRELKLKETEARIVVVADSPDPEYLNELYNWGAHACLIKQHEWQRELCHTLAAQSRLHRIEDANLRARERSAEMNQLLREKNRRLDEFAMTIAHDIRGPLGGISMNLEYVLDVYGSKLESRCHELLKRALQTSSRLTNVVQAMYEYARLGAKAAQMEQLSLSELVNEVITDLQFEDSLDIKIVIGDLPSVWGCGDLLRRVFINLINNAVKYNDKPQIVINIGFERNITNTLGRFAEVSVTDNGPGIPAEDLESIFSMFKRSSSAKSRDGLGVGLAVVQRIVELHYGEVRVESKPGAGTKFFMTLPQERVDLPV